MAPYTILDELTLAVGQISISRYLCGVALVLSLYDWLLLLEAESETVWKGRWTLPKIIYYFNRIVTPAGLMAANYQLTDQRSGVLSASFCRAYTFANSLIELLSFFLSNWLLTLRLVALYKRKPLVVWFLYTFLITSYLATLGLMVYTLYTFGLSIHYSSILHACSSNTRSPLMPAIFLAPAAYECTLFGLTGFKAWQDSKLFYQSSANAPFLTVLYRDGLICFVIMMGVRIWNVWIYATQPLSAAYLGIYLLWATMTILSTRVYLNLAFLVRGRHDTETAAVSRVKFASPHRLGGIQMRVQTTTVADNDQTITFGSGGRQNRRMLTTFDTTFSVDAPLPPLDESLEQGQITHSRDSLRQPFSSQSYARDDDIHELHRA